MRRDGPVEAKYRAQPALRDLRALSALAARQHGVVSMVQMQGLGWSARAVAHLVAVGRLHRLHRGVYAVGHRVLTRQGHWMAAVLACGEGAVLSHAGAAACWGLRSSAATVLDVTTPTRAGRSREGLRIHRGERLQPDERTFVDRVPCTTAARTLLDLSAVVDGRGLERACEQAERLGLLDLWAVTALLNRHRGGRGTARLRQVLAEWDPDLMRTKSELEVIFLRLVIRAGIKRPFVNVRIELPGGAAPEVDFHWPARRLAVETDGGAFHRSPIARRNDAQRDQALTAAGWRVHRFSHGDVTNAPQHTVATLRRLLSLPVP